MILRDLLRRAGSLAPIHDRRIVRLGSSMTDDEADQLEAEDAAIREAEARWRPLDDLADAAGAIARLGRKR